MNGPSDSPPGEPEPDLSVDVAAAMGFASFGAQDRPPPKKRRFNPQTATATTIPTTTLPSAFSLLPPKPPPPIAGFHGLSASMEAAASHLPLPPRGAGVPAPAGRNADEIDLGLSDEEVGGEPSGGAVASVDSTIVDGSGGSGTLGGNGQAGQGNSGNDVDDNDDDRPKRHPGPSLVGAPGHPAWGSGQGPGYGSRGGGGRGGGSRGGYGHGGGSGGDRQFGGRRSDDEWGKDYFDPSSIANPWERLEAAKGLKPVSPWP